VAADLGEEDPDRELERIVEEVARLAAMTEGGKGGSLRSRGDKDEEPESEGGDEADDPSGAQAEDETAKRGSGRVKAQRARSAGR
jgi:hypothetical protein